MKKFWIGALLAVFLIWYVPLLIGTPFPRKLLVIALPVYSFFILIGVYLSNLWEGD